MRKLKETLQMAPMRFRPISEELIDKLVADYPKNRAEYLKNERSRWAKENFSPFDIGYDCNAYHYYSMKSWEHRPEPDPDLLEIFSEGVLHEPSIVEKLKTAGFKISAFNVPFSLKWSNFLTIKGKIDLFVEADGIQIPVEAKSMAPYAYSSINTWEDFLKSKSSFHRCYPYQLVTYLHACNRSKFGLFALKDKCSGQVKLIKMPYIETMIDDLQRRVMVVSGIVQKNKGDIEQMKCRDSVWCNRCDFKSECLGSDGDKMTPLMEDKEIETMLLRREELKPLQSEYDKLDKTVKAVFKGKEELLIGDFYIKGKEQERKGFVVNDTKFWVSSIIYKGSAIKKKAEALDD